MSNDFFKMITFYLADEHPDIYVKLARQIKEDDFLTKNFLNDEQLRERARDFLQKFGLEDKMPEHRLPDIDY